MQPPPRKGNYTKFCKNLHTEQLAKLQAKNQQECDLLEDIRNFTKQRSAIEKSYGEALLKIATNYQNRKIACVPDIRLEDGSEAWNVYSIWRTVLDETEKIAKARLAAVEIFHQQISEDAKLTRQIKINVGKRLSEQLQTIQKELQLQVQELDRTKKLYFDEEHMAHDAREKANAAEEKLKRKKGSIFQSITSLQKNSAKFSARREMCDEKSFGARNDYLICLAATNAHQRRYYEIDFERILRTMENEMYEKVSEYMTLMARTELFTCSAAQVSYTKVREEAKTVTRGYNLRCYLTFYPMLGHSIQYDYDRCDGDKIDRVTLTEESAIALAEEGKKIISRIQRDVRTTRECNKKIRKLQAGEKVEGDQSNADPESRLEELKQLIRRAETSKYKAEAMIEIFKEGGVEVEDYSKSLDSESLAVDVESPSRSGSTVSAEKESEFATMDYDANQAVAAANDDYQPDSDEFQGEESYPQDEGRPMETLWEPITDWGDAPTTPLPPVTNGAEEDTTVYPKGTALYNYTAANPDELSIVENEELELIEEGDGDGWIKARNYKGEVGYIPQNYIEAEELSVVPQSASGTDDGQSRPVANFSFSSVEYNVETEDYGASAVQVAEIPAGNSKAQANVPNLNLHVHTSATNHKTETDYCRAMYDYEATCPEELTFEEGQLIKILKRAVNDVDDGWWEGEMDGGIVGLFPSLVVEECHSDGELLSPDDLSGASPGTTPPPHTPPEVPGFLLAPETIVTQPTPDVESRDLHEKLNETDAEQPAEQPSNVPAVNFDLELTGGQQELYHRQFSSSPESETTEREVEKHQYAELVSSPENSHREVEGKNVTAVPIVSITEESEDETKCVQSSRDEKIKDESGLNAMQIVITAATPMGDPPPSQMSNGGHDEPEHSDEEPSSECDGEPFGLDDDMPPPPPPAPEGPTVLTELTGAEGVNKEGDRESSPKSPSPSEGPPDLDPEKLKELEKSKESDA